MPPTRPKRPRAKPRTATSKAKARPTASPKRAARTAKREKPVVGAGAAPTHPPRRGQGATPAARAALLAAVIDHVPQGVCVVGLDLRLSIVNDQFGDLLRLQIGRAHV